ncbi:MAG: thiamine pyrophosphate-binding protein [Beijerinckiaceae bacterium]
MSATPSKTPPTGADLIGQALAAAGCRHAFGIPGGEVLALIAGLESAGVTVGLARHENAAGFMAEGTWHATGAPAVLFSTLGPGVANAVNVVANAQQDRVPLIFLTGCIDAVDAETFTHQVFDHQAVLRPLVKASFRATHGAIGPMMAKAIQIAQSGQPGPVHIDVPIGVAEAIANERAVPGHRAQTTQSFAEGDFEQARMLLKHAKRPLVITGVDAVNEGAGAALEAFCKATGAALITTYKGKGLIDEANPMVVGGAGLSPKADKVLMPLIAQADVIVLAGYDPIEMRIGWRDPWPENKTVIDITPTLRTHGMHSTMLTLQGDCPSILNGLCQNMHLKNTWPDKEPAKTRLALLTAFSGEKDVWGPAAVFDTLRASTPLDTVITADSGAHRILLSQMWQCHAPRTMLQSTGLCTMACSVPLAMGYKHAKPDTPVIAVVGDGGLEMGLGELATLRDTNLPLVIVVLVDASLALIAMKQKATGRAKLAVDLGRTDFAAVANAMGGKGVTVRDRDSLRSAISMALANGVFTVIACEIEAADYQGRF